MFIYYLQYICGAIYLLSAIKTIDLVLINVLLSITILVMCVLEIKISGFLTFLIKRVIIFFGGFMYFILLEY
jgi:hypothetical protein